MAKRSMVPQHGEWKSNLLRTIASFTHGASIRQRSMPSSPSGLITTNSSCPLPFLLQVPIRLRYHGVTVDWSSILLSFLWLGAVIQFVGLPNTKINWSYDASTGINITLPYLTPNQYPCKYTYVLSLTDVQWVEEFSLPLIIIWIMYT